MAKRYLNHSDLMKLKPGKALADPECRGLRWIAAKAGVYGQVRYKDATTGKWISKGLGRLPSEVELQDAHAAAIPESPDGVAYDGFNLGDALEGFRRKARALNGQVRAGIDPRTQAGPDGLPLDRALDRYEADLRKRGAAKGREVLSLLRRELLDGLGKGVWLGKITRPAVLDRCAAIAKSGRPGTAKELRIRSNVFLGWATNEGLIPANPMAGYRSPRRTRQERLADQGNGGRALSDAELGPLWHAAGAAGIWGAYLRFVLLTGQRRTETTFAQWPHIDVLSGEWHIPPEINKSGRVYRVPLPWLACGVLGDLMAAAPPEAHGLVFPGRRGAPMTGWSPLMRSFREAYPKLAPFTLHDLRRTVRTGYGRLGIAPHVAELALNHALSDDLARVYDKGEYWPERVRAADAWCEHVARVVG